MSVPVPFPRALALLLLALPGTWLLARALAHAVTRDLGLRRVLPIGLGLCLWLSAVHAASLASGSLIVGLPAATLALAAAGAIAERRRRRREEPATGQSPPAAMWISMAITAAFVAPAAFRFWFHDELPFIGHMSIAAQMQNGIYPPRHLALPDVPLRYHYGFDLLTACLTALLRLPIDRAIDVATILLWCASWCLFWVLGERLAGRAGAWLTPLLALFAGGAPIGCDRPGPSPWHGVLLECGVGARSVSAPVVSYFFQHPWALGIPLLATAAILLGERDPPSRRARLFALWLLLSLLSLGEIVLFAALLPAMVVAGCLEERAHRLRRGAALLAVAAAALGTAFLAGGFFARVPALTPLRLTLHAGFADSAAQTLGWNLRTFGALIPLGAAGLLLGPRGGRLLWALLAAGSIAIVNAVRFTGTDDIVKFATLGAIALGVLGSAAIARLLSRRTAARTIAAAALALPATAASGAFLLGFALDVGAIPAALRRAPEQLSPEEIEAMTFVRARAHAGELVYHGKQSIDGWAQWGGVAVPRRSWTDGVFGLPNERLTARDLMLARLPADASEYRAQGFAWFVVGGDEGAIGGVIDGWIREGEAREAARFGAVRVVELLPR